MESKSRVLLTAGAVSLMILAAGCSSTNWPRMGGGNQTSYATGSYPMPKKTAAAPTTPAPAATAAGQATVIAAQQALTKQGYDPGPADGTYGPSTQQAVSSFQKSHGLRESGDLDSSTL